MAQFAAIAALALMAGGSIMAGRSKADALNSEAAQKQQMADASFASGTAASAEEQRQSRLIQSRALAVAASSGAGALDPTVVNLVSGIAGQGDYNARAALYGAETQADSLRFSALQDNKAAHAARTGGYLNAGASAGSMYAKYG